MRKLALIAVAAIMLAGCGSSHPLGLRHQRPYPVVIHSPAVRAVQPKPIRLPTINCLCVNVITSPPRITWPAIVVRSEAALVSPTRLRIVTLGSSSCPSVPDMLVIESRHRLRIHLTPGRSHDGRLVADPPQGGACTADYGTTAMVVAINPKKIDVHRPLTVRFFYKNSKKPEVRKAAALKS
jgi:hypothetical protein